MQETLARVLFAPVVPPSQLRADVPPDLERVVMRLLQRERDARYPNAEAVIADLVACADHPRSGRELLVATLAERFSGRAPVRLRTASKPAPHDAVTRCATPPQLAIATPLPGPVAPTTYAGIHTSPRRRRVVGTSIGLAGVVVVVAVVFVVRSGSKELEPADRNPTVAPVIQTTVDAAPAPTRAVSSPDAATSRSAPVGSDDTGLDTRDGSNERLAGSGSHSGSIPSKAAKSTAESHHDAARKGGNAGSGIREVQLGAQ
jgi:hypothetical protein